MYIHLDRSIGYVSSIVISCLLFSSLFSSISSAQECARDCSNCTTSGAGSCDTCNPGFHRSQTDPSDSQSPYKCDPCRALYCVDCTDDTDVCTQCIPGAYVDSSNNKCTSCPPGCFDCTDGDTCSGCVPGFAANGTLCSPCAPFCSDCSTEGPGLCDENKCEDPSYPRNDADKVCEPCAPNCFQCSSPGKCDSDGCNPGYRFNNDVCEKCEVERCLDCSSNVATCVQCGIQTKYNPTKNECELCARNCKTCENNGPGLCDQCHFECYSVFDAIGNGGQGKIVPVCYGYHLTEDFKCARCKADNCIDCSSQDIYGQCDVCSSDGFFKGFYTAVCTRCSDLFLHCVACNDLECYECEEGYFAGAFGLCQKNQAYACARDCADCSSLYFDGRCDFCNEGFGLTTEKTCKTCAEYCTDCTVYGAGSCDPGYCRDGYRKVGDECHPIGLNGCQKASSDTVCDKCYPEGYYHDPTTQLCTNCTNSWCSDCDSDPAVCTRCATASRLDGSECIECKANCLRCSDTACLECDTIKSSTLFKHIPVTDALLEPDPNSDQCISKCAGQHGNFYNEPIAPELCPYEAPHGICIHGNLFRFNCQPTPILGPQWAFEYYRQNYTLADTCGGEFEEFSPTILPPRHFAFNNPLRNDFKDYKDMSPGFVSETVASFLRATPTSTPQNADGSPLAIGIEIFIASIYDVDDMKMQYKMTFWVRTYYRNCKLAFVGFNHEYEYVTLDNHDYLRFWMPDIFFTGERSTTKHTFSSPNLFMRLYKDGTLVTSQKVTVTLACNMKLHRFPLDKQDCPMDLASFTYPLSEMRFYWYDGGVGPALTVHHSATVLPEFDLVHFENKSCISAGTFAGGFPCLEVHLEFKRKLAFYMEQVYMPSALLVMISWIGPWVDKSITGSRTSIGLLTVLTVVTQAVGVNSRLPKVSYIKAVDVWMGVCLIQVVGGMLEFCIVNVITRAQEKKAQEEDRDEDEAERFEQSLAYKPRWKAYFMRLNYQRKRDTAYFIDLVSRLFFPLFFVVFNILYWTYYLAIFTENPA